jgi:hypothetical protein
MVLPADPAPISMILFEPPPLRSPIIEIMDSDILDEYLIDVHPIVLNDIIINQILADRTTFISDATIPITAEEAIQERNNLEISRELSV